MITTRTADLPVGLRQGWSAWQKELPKLLAWCQSNGLSILDVPANLDAVAQVRAAGMTLGTADLPAWKELISPEKTTRAQGVAKAASFITEAAERGATNFFCVMLPQKPELPRSENFNFMVDSFSLLAPTLEKLSAQVVIEGWPGPGALCCTPESLRALFARIPSPAMAINYDPSHLIRMNIDHLRFLKEFAPRVQHVHAKDAELLPENVYDFGTELDPTLAPVAPFAGITWRYTLPGRGIARWPEILQTLRAANYAGGITIELEDAQFNGTEDGEKRGILAAAAFLQNC